jgi:hypothetical protein
MAITFHPAFKAQLSGSTPGLIIADWNLNSVEWAVADKTLINTPGWSGQYYKFRSNAGTTYYLAPLVPTINAYQKTTISSAGSYVAYTPNYTHSDHYICTPDPPPCSGPYSFIDDSFTLNDMVSVGFFSPNTLINTIAITGTARKIGYSYTVYGFWMNNNAGSYYQENLPNASPERLPVLYQYYYGGRRSELTKRAILYQTDTLMTDMVYHWGYDTKEWTITNIRTLTRSVYTGKSIFTKRSTYTINVNGSQSYQSFSAQQNGDNISYIKSDIYYKPLTGAIIKSLKGLRFPNIATYDDYNTGESDSDEVAYIVLNHQTANYNVTYNYGFPLPWLADPATQTKSTYYGILHSSDSFVSRLIPTTELFQGLYAYLGDMYIVASGFPPEADPIDDNPDTLPDPGGDPQEITFRWETYKAIRSERD